MPTGWAVVIVVQWLAIVALTVVVLGVLRQVTPSVEQAAGGRMLRFQQLPAGVGTKLPAFASGSDGNVTDPAALLEGRPAVMLFLSVGCTPCLSLTAEMMNVGLPEELARSLIAVTDPGDEDGVGLTAGVRVLGVPRAECIRVLGTRGRPFAMAVDADGLITAKRPVNTLAQLAEVAASAWPQAIPLDASADRPASVDGTP